VKSERVIEGRADEGERILTIVKQMEREDEKSVWPKMEGWFYWLKRDAIPAEWTETSFNKYRVVDTWKNEWEYRENEII
jgi:hypothetical protein